MTRPPLVIVKPKSQYDVQRLLKQVRADQVEQHPYDEARKSHTPIALANFILNERGMIAKIAGEDYIDGKPATPLVKMQATNRVLKSLGLAQIDGPGWRV